MAKQKEELMHVHHALLVSMNILRIISGTEYFGGIVCHAETKSISLTSPNACQFMLAPKGTKKAFVDFSTLSGTVLFAIHGSSKPQKSVRIFIRSSVVSLTLMGEI
ncbi:hypothetical protein P4S72_13145 [Vibrio sp. PP-XX7]